MSATASSEWLSCRRQTTGHFGQAEKYGARLALFGRKINLAESSTSMNETMRRVIDGELTPAEAVRSYHDLIGKLGLRPKRSLDQDTEIIEEPLKKAA